VKRSSRNYECSDDSFSTAAFLVASVVYVDVVLKSGSLHDFFLGRGQLNLGGSPALPPEDFLAWRQPGLQKFIDLSMHHVWAEYFSIVLACRFSYTSSVSSMKGVSCIFMWVL